MKVNILFGRPTRDGLIRTEIGTLLIQITAYHFREQRIDAIFHRATEGLPAHVARNALVQEAREKNCTILGMVDSDMWPADNFFPVAFDFLLSHAGPAAISSPYVTGPPEERVVVSEYTCARTQDGPQSIPPNSSPLIESIPRNDAARRKGIERVGNMGTGYVFYKMSCFDCVKPPYFDYDYTDAEHTNIRESEDCWLHRRLWEVGVPLYVSWDHWSKHRKWYWADKPKLLGLDEPGRYWMELAKQQVESEHRYGSKTLAALVPQDVPGWCDYADLYKQIVDGVQDGAHLVEVGSFMGQSAITMARLLKRSGKRIKFTCVDHFQGDPSILSAIGTMPANTRELFESNLRKYQVEDRVELLPMPSVDAAKLFPDEALDFVFIDGSHEEEDVTNDIRDWLPKVRPGGILAGHDFDWMGVVKAVANCFPKDDRLAVMGRCWVYQKRG